MKEIFIDKNYLSELMGRAQKSGYKNVIPRLPKKPTASTMVGYNKRMRNWVKNLEILESYQ